MKRIILLIGLIGLLLVGCKSSTSGTRISPEVLNQFIEKDNVEIIIQLEIDRATIDEVLSTLPKSEFELKGRINSTNVFFGDITKKGLDILIDNPQVVDINYDAVVPMIDDEYKWNH